jgi:hypothetical protein
MRDAWINKQVRAIDALVDAALDGPGLGSGGTIKRLKNDLRFAFKDLEAARQAAKTTCQAASAGGGSGGGQDLPEVLQQVRDKVHKVLGRFAK